MLTAQEVRNITFDRVMRGYRVEDVDAFMVQMADDMEAVQQEKKAVEDKLYLLAEKLEEYRSQEEALRSAIVNAQRISEDVTKEAQAKADGTVREAAAKAEAMIREATAKAERIIEATDARAQREDKAFQKMRQEITSFRNTVLELYKEHIDLLSTLPVDGEEDAAEDAFAAPADAASASEEMPADNGGLPADAPVEAAAEENDLFFPRADAGEEGGAAFEAKPYFEEVPAAGDAPFTEY